MTVAPTPQPADNRYTKGPAEVYAARLAGVVARLHQLGDQVAYTGRPSLDPHTLHPAHAAAAARVTTRVLRGVAELGLAELHTQAVRADHPDANMVPGMLLDRAAVAVQDGLDEPGAPDPVAIAEGVLRAVGLLR
jgi:hypothetical protein